MKDTRKVLIQCTDQPGLVHKITGVLYNTGLNIVSYNEFVDPKTKSFFSRSEVEGAFHQEAVEAGLKTILPKDAVWKLPMPGPKKVAILVTKEPYCLVDILVRSLSGDFPIEILGVAGNHPNLEKLSEGMGYPFSVISHEGCTREEHEEKICQWIDNLNPEYIILAKYMRILSPNFVSRYQGKTINIHHSFLPAFKGAKPYAQAHERGVKIIGATAHYVTDDLDEGPIICQDVIPVNHRYDVNDMIQAGRDVEKNVLSKAVRLVTEDRVFIHGNKTVVFL